jgi:hypothetical protein
MWVLKFTLEKQIFWKFPNIFFLYQTISTGTSCMGLEQIFITSNKRLSIIFNSPYPFFFASFFLLHWPFPNPHPEARKIVAVRDYCATTWDTHYDKST